MNKKLAIVAATMILAMVNMAFADVTGDFKVLASTYTNSGNADGGDVTVSGTVNHGAVQSGKKVVVDVKYGYSFEYQTTSTETNTVTVPARCPNASDHACRSNDGSANWRPSTTTYTTVVTHTFDGASSMIAITAPTVTNGRLNPKGKITGYNWTSTFSVLPSDSLVDPVLIPDGATVVSGSVQITDVSWRAYLVDSAGNEISDTVNEGSFTF